VKAQLSLVFVDAVPLLVGEEHQDVGPAGRGIVRGPGARLAAGLIAARPQGGAARPQGGADRQPGSGLEELAAGQVSAHG
jgi:hypothetical protein